MRLYLIVLMMLVMPVSMASKYSTGHGHDVVEFNPKVSCLYEGKLYGPGSTVKQPTGLYICKPALKPGNAEPGNAEPGNEESEKEAFYEWVRVVGAQ